METPLYSLLILVMFRHAAMAVETGRTGLASALAVAVGVCRPDGALAVGVALVGIAVARPRIVWRFIWPPLTTALVVIALAWGYYGTLVPQSVLAKAAGERTVWGGVRVLGELLLGRFHFVPTALAVVGAVALWRTGIAWRWLILWWLGYVAAFSLSGAFARFDWYFTPLQPVLWGCTAAGLELVAFRVFSRGRAQIAFAVASFAMIALAVRGWPVHRAAWAEVHAIREEPVLIAGRWIASSKESSVQRGGGGDRRHRLRVPRTDHQSRRAGDAIGRAPAGRA